MAIKLRSFSTSMVTKVIAMLLFAASMTLIMTQLMYLVFMESNLESLYEKEYKNSSHFSGQATVALSSVSGLLHGQSPASVKVPYYFYATDGKKTVTNTTHKEKDFYARYDKAFYCYENGNWYFGQNTEELRYMPYHELTGKETIYIAFSDQFLEIQQKEWMKQADETRPIVFRIVIGLALAILMVIFLICVAGRRPEDKELHMSLMDSLYSDILMAAFVFFIMLWALGMDEIMDTGRMNPGVFDGEELIVTVFVGVLTAAVSLVCGVVALAVTRKIKARRLLKHSFVFRICYHVYDFFKSLFDGRKFERYPLTKSLFYRQLVFIPVSAVLVFFTFLFLYNEPALLLLPPALEVLIIYWYVKGNNKTYEQINRGFNESLEEQMKAERMKIALVTNVSHDLKTPLTSIISYIDLLSKEEGLSEEAGDYIRILEEKSNRLKTIVADLFDLAKSTSGDISLDMEKIDIKRLVEQTMADMEDRITESGLPFKIKLPENPVNIMADGKKLYRVFQNIIDNALKYSLKGTRVFVEMDQVDGRVVTTLKNTAGYEMDFTAFEILQRFSRGDKARSTEGSGLGLSIAESFTNVCGGNFKVEIDGDLFKVMLAFNTLDRS